MTDSDDIITQLMDDTLSHLDEVTEEDSRIRDIEALKIQVNILTGLIKELTNMVISDRRNSWLF